MRDNALLQMCSGRYYQGRGVLGKLGQEAALLGKRALIVADTVGWDKAASTVTTALEGAGITWAVYPFSGFCCPEHYNAACALGIGAELVIGLGGGRALDAAKIAADKLGLRVITVPTSASTCAATAWLAVDYEDNGRMTGNYWSRFSPFSTLVDLDIVALDCPIRYFIAGVLDAMAKYPEILYNLHHPSHWERNIYSFTAAKIAEESFHFLLTHAADAMHRCAEGIVDGCVEDVVCATISLTGLTSVLACGGKQAAISHSLYACFCANYPEVNRAFVHGELVSASLPYQMQTAGIEETIIQDYVKLAREFGAPVCLKDLGLEPASAELDRLFDYLRQSMPIPELEELERIRGMEQTLLNID